MYPSRILLSCLLLVFFLLPYVQYSTFLLSRGEKAFCSGFAAALPIQGSGEPWVTDVYGSLGTAYMYMKDDISMTYAATATNVSASLSALPGGRLYYVSTSSDMRRYLTDNPTAVNLNGEGIDSLVQIPVMATAMVAAYTTSSVAGTSGTLILSRQLVAAIWNGSVTDWGDAAVLSANSGLTAPAAGTPIRMVFCDDVLGEGGVLANYLRSIDPSLAAIIDVRKTAAFASVPAVLQGRALVACKAADKKALLAANPDALVFMMYPDFKKEPAGLSIARMTDRVGNLVTLDTPAGTAVGLTTVTKAMTVSAVGDKLVFDLTDQANSSWPLSALSTMVLHNYTANSTTLSTESIDCSTIKEVLSFLSWTQVNDKAIAAIQAAGFATLSGRQRMNMLDTLSEVVCNNQQALTKAFLLGMGPTIPTYTSWATEYGSGGGFTLKYFSTSSVEGFASLVDNSVDFASTGAPLNNDQRLALPDVMTVPMVSYGFVFSYNLPELINTDYRLTLSFEIMNDIYMNRIKTWDDPRITALNPEVAHLLPVNQSIIVTYFTTAQVISTAINRALCLYVPEFNQTYFNKDVVPYPVAAETNRTKPCATLNEATAAMRTPYALGQGVSFTAFSSSYLRPSSLRLNGRTLSATRTNIVAGITNAMNPTDLLILGSPGNDSWPMISTNALAVHTRNMVDCNKAKELVDWIYWTQTDPTAANIAQANKLIVAGQSAPVRRAMLTFIANVTCGGQTVSAMATCIVEGTICSDHGSCYSGRCVCDSGWTGTYCEQPVSSAGSTEVVVPLLATFLPLLAILVLAAVLLVALLVWRLKVMKNKRDDWEVPYSEIELGDPLGQGGYGSVYKSVWRGTTVAVKVITEGGDRVSKDIERNFRDEVSIMSNLRHPNVVLFMGACTKPPNMFIIMEFMTLGSLFDLLHNELIPDLPRLLRTKMMYQAAKGMHFLHSSGVVHCDLKSLNLLLDAKWNLKVSDFGLTKVKSELVKTGTAKGGLVGTVHWTAPEVLAQSENVDFVLADVYSYGIVMWETFTRDQPYAGLSPAAIAVAVLRDNYRPPIPEGYDLSSAAAASRLQESSMVSNSISSRMSTITNTHSGSSGYLTPEYEQDLKYLNLMSQCWHQDPMMRPSFLDVMTQLSSSEYGGGRSGGTSTSSSSMTGSFSDISSLKPSVKRTGMDTGSSLDSGNTMSSSEASSNSMELPKATRIQFATTDATAAAAAISENDAAVVFLDIPSAHILWQQVPEDMVETMTLYNDIVRKVIAQHKGLETIVGDRGNAEGSMCVLFANVDDACHMCYSLQKQLLKAEWPSKLLAVSQAEEVIDPDSTDQKAIFRGLRVRCGVHVGTVTTRRNKDVRKIAKHSGPAIDAAMKLASMAKAGQVVISADVRQRLLDGGKGSKHKSKFEKPIFLRRIELPLPSAGAQNQLHSSSHSFVQVSEVDGDRVRRSSEVVEVKAYELPVPGLNRVFARKDGADESDESEDEGSSTIHTDALGRGAMHDGGDVESWLNSANMCPWIVDYSKVTVYEDKPLGSGSYGVVFRGKWQNVDVAVKRFVKQTMNERHMLEFRSEMSIMSRLHHPNIITFIGACVQAPNMCIITEYMKNGNLRAILSRPSVKLSFPERMRMLLHTSLGLQYLHDTAGIIHRDLKCSNILVDESDGVWTVKIADFGFARVKETNATMTRCGTPSWIAPEIIRGEKNYTEKADIYSLGIIMWEMLTRRVPFDGLNFMDVSLYVLDNKRPDVPDSCPPEFKKMMSRCWHGKPKKRPAISEIVEFFSQMVGGDSPFDV